MNLNYSELTQLGNAEREYLYPDDIDESIYDYEPSDDDEE